MKLTTFALAGGAAQLGAVRGDRVIPLNAKANRLPETMLELIQRWDEVRGQVEAIVEAGEGAALAHATLLAPLARPGKILAMGLNYADHVAEARLERPQHQVWFCKQPNSIHAPYAPIQLPKASQAVDYEAELVFVIGKGGRHIPKEEAAEHVFGYCVGNDVTARDWQRRTPQWMLAKSFDTHGPIGPWITTADEIGDPHRLDIRSLVNGEVRQNSNTRELIFDVFDQIACLSEAMTLEPGDIVFSGTPGGVGAAMKPQVFLQAGDTVRCEIEALGAIEGVFEAER